LNKGATFSFIGYTFSGSYVKELSQDSQLYRILCGTAGHCSFALDVELESDLTCYNEECSMDTVEVVKVATGYYEYVRPTCVNHYFAQGQISVTGSKYDRPNHQTCRHPESLVAGTSCCAEVDGVQQEARVCGQPSERVRFSVAEATCASLGLAVCDRTISTASCGYDDMHVWTPMTCTTEIAIDASGKVSAQTSDKTKQNKVTVQWLNGFPSASECPSDCTVWVQADTCVCTATTSTQKVFDYVPSKEELKANLKVGAFEPRQSCSVCSGDVKAYTNGGVIDETTVFENDGRFYKNMQSIVSAGGYEFRNPPAFMDTANPTEQQALAEVEALLDHFFQHPNTPLFVSYRLIQRFGNSNPSANYLSDVAEAFRTGEFDGNVYSGKYGDLAATIAAVLLHPEARNPGLEDQGALREPLIKIIHFLRAMEYVDSNHSEIVFDKLDDVIGEEPFQSPSVFNYYQPEYQPSSFSDGRVGPEFQIHTAPNAVGLINGLMSMIDHGVSAMDKGLGYSLTNQWDYPWYYKQGEYQLQQAGNVDDTIAELNLLLTGGRLSSTDAVKTAYQAAQPGDEFKAAQRAIVLSPEFHTIGNPLTTGTRIVEPAPAPVPVTDYKATVMLFMGGGADTFNMLVPYEGRLWSEYQTVRQDIALAEHELLNITTAGQNISQFAVHHKLPFLQELYGKGQAAFVSNIGALVEPITKEQYKAGQGEKCVGLFSHSDQQAAAATLKCQVAGTSPKGAGGRISDALKAQNYQTHSFSIAGTATWSQGFQTNQEIIHHSEGAVRLQDFASVSPLLKNMTAKKHHNVYCEEYAQSIRNFVEASQQLGDTLDATVLETSYDANAGWLAKQLRQVARLIKAREARNVERDLFYVTLGGFDTHSLSGEVLDLNFEAINGALQEFVGELEEQGIFDSVVVASESDFGRTLSTNGAGTDHAWAGNHFILGGKVNGGRVYNDFPSSLLLDSEQDLGRGRLVPKFPWENMMVPIAEWMGVQEQQHTSVFPNLANFDRSEHILAKDTLFRA
jgi:cullin-associated NEDD8-dissociated protein 1